VGNWLPRKGILSLLEAFAALPADAATLHLVGDAEADLRYGAAVAERLERADLRDRVVTHGVIAIEEVDRLYRGADLFVLPSLLEPYGTVYGEAMAAGLPVVGWRAGNLPHLARDGREGLIVDPGDVVGLTRAIGRLVDDEDLRAGMARAARARAETFPTWSETGALFFDAVRRLAGIRG